MVKQQSIYRHKRIQKAYIRTGLHKVGVNTTNAFKLVLHFSTLLENSCCIKILTLLTDSVLKKHRLHIVCAHDPSEPQIISQYKSTQSFKTFQLSIMPLTNMFHNQHGHTFKKENAFLKRTAPCLKISPVRIKLPVEREIDTSSSQDRQLACRLVPFASRCPSTQSIH